MKFKVTRRDNGEIMDVEALIIDIPDGEHALAHIKFYNKNPSLSSLTDTATPIPVLSIPIMDVVCIQMVTEE